MDKLQLDLLLPYCAGKKKNLFQWFRFSPLGCMASRKIGTLQILAKIRVKLSRHKQLIMPLSPM
jgi:hypothetical protein